MLTFNLSVVNEELFTKQSQSFGNQSSLTSLQMLIVRLSVVNDVLSAKSICSAQNERLPFRRSPFEYSFAIRVSVVNELFFDKPLFSLGTQLSQSGEEESPLTITVRVVTDSFSTNPSQTLSTELLSVRVILLIVKVSSFNDVVLANHYPGHCTSIHMGTENNKLGLLCRRHSC